MANSNWALWDVYTQSAPLTAEAVSYRQRLFDAAEQGDWPTVLARLDLQSREKPWVSTVNLVRPDDTSWHSLMHLAVLARASAQVVEDLSSRGHFRSTRCARGKRPIDLAIELGHEELIACLEPVFVQSLPEATLAQLQNHFHNLVRETSSHAYAFRLPALEILLECEDLTLTFLVPMMTISCQLQQVAFPCPQPLDAGYVHREWLLLARLYDRMGEGCDSYYVVSSQGSHLVQRGE